MNIKSIIFLSLLAVSTMITPTFCEEEIDISKIPTSSIPTIEDLDWSLKSGGSPRWFTPVIVKDEFEGNYVAVFDKHWEHPMRDGISEMGIISNWFPKTIRIYSYVMNEKGTSIRESIGVTIKVGSKAYHLTGKQGNFTITPELAYALKTAPVGAAKIKTEFANSGIPIVSNIAQGTVSAWKIVYRNADTKAFKSQAVKRK